MDYSKLSDDDLKALAKKDYSKISDQGLKYISGKAETGIVKQEPLKVNTAPGALGRSVGINATPQQLEMMKQFAINSLPTAGAIGGEVIGGPLGAFGGAAAGSAAKQYFNPPQDKIEAIKTAAKDIGYNALAPWAIGKGLGLASNAIKGAKAQNFINNKVQNISEFEPYIQGKINEAKQLYYGKQIAPRMLEQEARVSGQTVKINPDQFMGITPELDAEMNGLKNQIEKQTYGEEAGYTGPKISEIEVPGKEALRYRAMLNKASQFGPQDIGSGAATARVESAQKAGDVVRGKLANIDEAIPQTSKELQEANALQDAVLKQEGSNPSAIIKGSDLGRQSRLAQYDEAAGTDLAGLGERADSAQRMYSKSRAAKTIGDWQRLVLDKLKKTGYEAVGPASEVIEPYSSAVLDPAAAALQSPYGTNAIRLTPWQQLYKQYSEENK